MKQCVFYNTIQVSLQQIGLYTANKALIVSRGSLTLRKFLVRRASLTLPKFEERVGLI